MAQTVLITGGSRGIGEAIVRLFAERGWSVIFTFVSNSAAAHKVATEAGARAIRCDSGDEDDILALFDALDGEGIQILAAQLVLFGDNLRAFELRQQRSDTALEQIS